MQNWPLFDLRVVTPRLTLVYPTDEQIDRLASLAAAGIHDADRMPFATPWSRVESPLLERNTLQYHWRERANWKPEAWVLPLVAIVSGEVVGNQVLSADGFAVTRAVGSGSWLGRRYQGQGLGKEMRAAVLHLAFAGLSAQVAYTSAFADNAPSLGVTRALGYTPNGSRMWDREGERVIQLHFALAREDWERRRRADITIEGLEQCSAMFGLE